MKKLLIPLFALVLAGAGCPFGGSTDVDTKTEAEKPAASVPAKPEPNPEPKPEVKAEVKTETKTEVKTEAEPEPAPSTDGPRALTPATTDDTWKLYTSSTLGFSFMWPTKGRYAPEWEVKYYKPTDPVVEFGCYQLSEVAMPWKTVSVGGRVFCHSQALGETDTGDRLWRDAYATKIENTIVVIHFSKTVALSNSLFVETEYHAFLDGIVGTFKKAE